eukprot:jgi/Psemu1/286916/fgenesh1_pg.165_\
MATLTAIGFTSLAGSFGFIVSMISFGFATSKQSTFIAARCSARPKTVIYNSNPNDACQDRGSVYWGWVPWVMKLSYATMLNGVPGTGTRDGGLSGLMLKVNLDGIVLIRFHHLCLRVSSLAVFLHILIVLPLYRTSQCSAIGGDLDAVYCQEQNLTDYQRFTMENIPFLQNSTQYDEGLKGFFLPAQERALLRLYMVVFVSWIVISYTYVLLEREWRDMLALRRVYFLEADHWNDRSAELEETLLRDEQEKKQGIVDIESGMHYSKTRDPWIHHPEQRDTVPNIELYSVLVGGLPSLPTEALLQEDVKAAFSRKQSIDWQLAVTSAFFDHCVPNQPGFSSSVAAVTILPAASQITEAWKHWYKTAAKVRRLRFIRQEIAKIKEEMNVNRNKNDTSRQRKSKRNLVEKRTKKSRNPSVYVASEEKKKYYNEVLGTTDDLNVTNNFLNALNLGPEQTAVYSREFAQGAANIAPYGWYEARVRKGSLEELLEMEKHAIDAVEEASQALQKAQGRISHKDPLSEELDLEGLMVSATNKNDCYFEKDQHGLRISASSEKSELPDKPKPSRVGNRLLNFSNKNSSLSDNKVEDDGIHSRSDMAAYNDLANHTADELPRTDRHSLFRSLTQNLEILHPVSNESKHKWSTTKESAIRTIISGERILFENNKQPENKRISNALDALGLEAGLFLEQKNLSIGFSQHVPRNSLFRSTSAEDIPELHRDKTAKTLFVSTQREHPTHRRSRSCDDINLLEDFLDFEDSSESDTECTEERPNLLSQDVCLGKDLFTCQSSSATPKDEEKDVLDREKLAYEPHEPDHFRRSIEKNISSRTSSIWEKIASEKNRRSEIRKRLDSVSKSFNQRIPTEARTESLANEVIEQNNRRSSIPLSQKTIHTSQYDHGLRCADVKKDLKQGKSNADMQLFAIDELNNSIDFNGSDIPRTLNDEKIDPALNGSYSGSAIFESIMAISKKVRNLSAWPSRSTEIVDPFDLAGESTFAVVTFTSRQAAVAARYCLVDSRGGDRWNTVSDLPSPPLADAPVCNLTSCVRPVTISINDRQKMIRHTLAISILVTIYIFYIIPLAQVQQLLSPKKLEGIAPDINIWLQNHITSYIFSGFIPAMVTTGFYGICPPMFKAIANFGSNASSAACAEGSAMRYFWWFMIVSAFTGTSLASALIESFKEGDLNLSMNFQKAMVRIASTIPTTVSAIWLNWIIVRASLVLPTQYILQINTFLFSWLGIKSLARAVQGGGSGGPIPYRIYIDSGVVMLCLLALAPASPLIAIPAFAYFRFSVPMLRWVLIFLYKPKFDVGGARFPFIFDMCVSGIIAGQSLLGTMLVIRGATGPAVLAFLPLCPILFYRWILLKRYLRPFTDVALLQTSLLDGWDTNEVSCASKREEFRQFLVDCHKAAYVPVCIASDESTVITSEPAVVVPLGTDYDEDDDDTSYASTEYVPLHNGQNRSFYHKCEPESPLCHPYEPHKQIGPMIRRAGFGSSMHISPMPLGGGLSPKREDKGTPTQNQKRVIRNHTLHQMIPKVPIIA